MNDYAICTFHKCGSNWFRDIFFQIAELQDHSFIHYPENESRFGKPVRRGPVTQHVFSTGLRKQYDEVFPGSGDDIPTVFCVRDPKDATVSQYFSWRNSHKNNSPRLLEWRDKLQSMPPKDGIEALLKAGRISYLNNLSQWADNLSARSDSLILKYEDLLDDFQSALRPVLDRLGAEVSDAQLSAIYESTRFESKVERRSGEEDQSSHYRKGVAGDSKNYFDANLNAAFDEKYGELPGLLGYIS